VSGEDGGGGWGGWRGWVSGLMMPVDTADQVVCTVGQTDGNSSPTKNFENT